MNINNKDVIQSYIMTTAKYDFSAMKSVFSYAWLKHGNTC